MNRMHHVFAADLFESVLISRLLLTPINGSTRFHPDLFYLVHGTTRSCSRPPPPPSASALTFHGFVLMFTAGRLKSVLLWRRKESGGVDTGGAPGWAGIPHVDVQSLENDLKSRPGGVMVVTRRWPAERGRQLWSYSACLLKSHVCRLLQTSSCHGSTGLLCLFLTR